MVSAGFIMVLSRFVRIPGSLVFWRSLWPSAARRAERNRATDEPVQIHDEHYPGRWHRIDRTLAKRN